MSRKANQGSLLTDDNQTDAEELFHPEFNLEDGTDVNLKWK